MKIKNLTITTGLFILMLCSNQAFALKSISRACRFADIPFGAQNISVLFFYAVGADRSVLALPSATEREKERWWILESLTVDYGEQKYYLYASSAIFVKRLVDGNSLRWVFDEDHQSPGWRAEIMSENMKNDPNFAPYYVNRGILSSARAGDPKIVSDRSLYDIRSGSHMVRGYHWYYDPVKKLTIDLPDTVAVDCNIPNIGSELWDR